MKRADKTNNWWNHFPTYLFLKTQLNHAVDNIDEVSPKTCIKFITWVIKMRKNPMKCKGSHYRTRISKPVQTTSVIISACVRWFVEFLVPVLIPDLHSLWAEKSTKKLISIGAGYRDKYFTLKSLHLNKFAKMCAFLNHLESYRFKYFSLNHVNYY